MTAADHTTIETFDARCSRRDFVQTSSTLAGAAGLASLVPPAWAQSSDEELVYKPASGLLELFRAKEIRKGTCSHYAIGC